MKKLLLIAMLLMGCQTPEQSLSGRRPGPFCDDCQFLAAITSVGTCGKCGGETSSGAFELCEACAETNQLCTACSSPLE